MDFSQFWEFRDILDQWPNFIRNFRVGCMFLFLEIPMYIYQFNKFCLVYWKFMVPVKTVEKFPVDEYFSTLELGNITLNNDSLSLSQNKDPTLTK